MSNLRWRLTLKLLTLKHFVVDFLAAPVRWNQRRIDAKRAHELALVTVTARAQADTIKALGETLITIVDRQARQSEAQTAVLQTWLDSFKVTQAPSTTTVSDKDEYDAEMNELMERDGINDSDPAAVMAWLDNMAMNGIR